MNYLLKSLKTWGWGIGDWGLGIGDWGLGYIPDPQSPNPKPQLCLCTLMLIYKCPLIYLII